jgi:hypothetical protein
VDVAAALRELHAAGLSHGDLSAGTVILTGAGAAALAEVGVLAAVRDAPIDVGIDAHAWAGLARELATAAPEADLLERAAQTAARGDLTAAARRLALEAAQLPDFATRDGLSALLPTLAPAPPRIPGQRTSTMESLEVAVRLRFGPGVPDEALLNPRPAPDAAAPRRGLMRRLWPFSR